METKMNKAQWRRKSRRAFLAAGAAGVLGVLGASWALTRRDEWGIPWPLRSAQRANETLWRNIYGNGRLGATPPAPEPGTEARVNGDIGLDYEGSHASWRLTVNAQPEREAGNRRDSVFTLDRIHKMPQTETTELFKCIEGWSMPLSYRGVRFSDFLAATGLGTRDGQPWSPSRPLADLYRYVGLVTPDGAYYVSLDMESMLHPKTILATAMNGAPLSDEHGAPLRLIVPVKYGIKSLKRIGRIFFSDTQPPDYWAEQGYDWYAAL